ncbi:cytosolic Fe-S cluster assembly factor NAR1, putative [Hepatocystis sp. ex Piliocolobus tephrosceles]|nr:cytosolic Fe-S cluster assembly factor NAR1, putative [Hepatocystis sp. ex Piliocolobus tephrosceles]
MKNVIKKNEINKKTRQSDCGESFNKKSKSNTHHNNDNYIRCSNNNHIKYTLNKHKFYTNFNSEQDKEKGKESVDFKKMNKGELFRKLYDTMHNDKFTTYVNSNNCTTDSLVKSFLKNVLYIFNSKNYHIFSNTISSKKKTDTINW